MTMLSEVGVTVEWTWERTMRETIVNPFYKVLKSLAERKTAFEAYINELHEAEAAARKTSLDKARKGWMSAMERLGGGDEERGIQSWWSWEKGAGELEKRMSPPEVWNNVRNDEERRTLFNEFIAAKKLREVGRLQSLRVENLAKLANIFQSLSLDLAGPLRWREVHSTILSTQAWQSDPNLQRIAQVDILAAYEEELNKAEREQGDERRRVGEEKRRRNRKAREAFVVSLSLSISS
jgi:pre-mRNA-processing factor 40